MLKYLPYIIGAIVVIIVAVAAFFIGVAHRKRVAEREIGSAEAQAKKILEDAIKAAESKKK